MFAWTAYTGSEDGNIIQRTVKREKELSGEEVLIQVTAAGLCATDVNFRYKSMVLGHEAVGIVEQIGPKVQHLEVGDRVGWGYQHGSCGSCDACLTGNEVHCASGLFYGSSRTNYGAFATYAVWNESFLFPIPDNLADVEAAPLMCAGATVFSALKKAGISPGGTIGVLGFGGLGHLAVQFAARQGYRVTVISRTEEKRNDALKLGASEFHTTHDAHDPCRLDVLIVTADHLDADWSSIIDLVALKGKMFILSIVGGNIEIPALSLVTRGLQVHGSVIAPRHCVTEMLRFAAHNTVRPEVQVFPLTKSGVSKAMSLLQEGKIRYRAVLVPGLLEPNFQK